MITYIYFQFIQFSYVHIMNLTFSRLNCNFWLKISHLSVPYSDIWSLGCILYELCTLRHPVSMGLLLSEKFWNSKNLDTKAWSIIPFLAALKCYVSSHKFLHNLSGVIQKVAARRRCLALCSQASGVHHKKAGFAWRQKFSAICAQAVSIHGYSCPSCCCSL